MNSIRNKMKKKDGFTLIEMLVVIAIIVILVAISVPAVSGALEKARVAADAANLQAAKSVALLKEMENTSLTDTLYYNPTDGTLENAKADAYKGQSSTLKEKIIAVTFTNGKITTATDWIDFTSAP